MKKLTLPYYIEPPFSYFKVCYKDRTYKEQYMNVDSILYDTNTATTLSGMISTYKNIFSVIKPIIKHNEQSVHHRPPCGTRACTHPKDYTIS